MEQADPATQARGEMIQLRVRAAPLLPESPERGRMEMRVQELRHQHEAEWLGGLGPLLAGWAFERGMVLIEITRESLRRTHLAYLVRQPGWKWVIGLKGVLLSAEEIRQLAVKALLAGLTSLDLCDCEVGGQGVRELMRADDPGYLAALNLGYARCGDEGTAALAESARASRLTVLELCNNGITAAGIRGLAASPHFSCLSQLNLGRNPLSDEGARVLAHTANLPALTHLGLSGCGISDRGAIAFADSTQRQDLELLDLRDNPLGKAMCRELAERYGSHVLLV
jgi:hypothetical protein